MSIARNASYNIAGFALPVLLSIATVPAYLHVIGTNRYGIISIAWLFLGYFGLFDLGLGRAIMNRMAKLGDADAQDRATLFWTAFTISLVVGVFGALILWLAATYFFTYHFKVDLSLRIETLTATPLLAASVPVATLTGVMLGALQGREQFLRANLISTTSTVIFQLLPLVVAYAFGPNITLLLATALCARLIGIVLMYRACVADFGMGHERRFDRALVRQLLLYGGWITAAAIIGPVLVITDRFVVGATLGAAAVAIYTIPAQLADRISLFAQALSTALFPRLSIADEENATLLSDQAVRSLLLALTSGVIIAIFLVKPAFSVWLGASFPAEATLIAQILLVGYVGNSLAYVPFARLQASGRPDLVTKVLAFEIFLYLPLLWYLLTSYGLFGAAAALSTRLIFDYIALGQTTGKIPALGPAIGTFGLLLSAVVAANKLTEGSVNWFAALAGLTACSIALTWYNAPEVLTSKIKDVVFDLPALRRRFR